METQQADYYYDVMLIWYCDITILCKKIPTNDCRLKKVYLS